MTSSSASLGELGSSMHSLANISSAGHDAVHADMFTLKCETGFFVAGLQVGEAYGAPNTLVCTLVTMSVTSAWIGRRKSIKKLLIFFSHWLSGLFFQLLVILQGTMISVCWAGANLANLIKAITFLELTSKNVLVLTNLAICINLALIAMSHRTMSRVKSFSSPPVVLLCVVLSVGAAAASVPFWDTIVVTGTYFFPTSENQRVGDWITISGFFLEFAVGTCMFVIMAWLLLFRMMEIKECWKMHARIRYYFGLTLIGIVVNLALGVSGTVYIIGGREKPFLILIAWTARHMHIALDTVVLYSVLGAPARQMDELLAPPSSDPVVVSGPGSRSSGRPGCSSISGVPNTGGLSKRSSAYHRAPSARKRQGRPKESSTASRSSQSD